MMIFSQWLIQVSLLLSLFCSTTFSMEGNFTDERQNRSYAPKQTHDEGSHEVSDESIIAYLNDGIRVDLHGFSENGAKQLVVSIIKQTQTITDGKPSAIHFITGRGNHANSKGNRGTLFKNFPTWLEDKQISHLIVSHHRTDGAYEVFIKQPDVKAPQDIRLKVDVIKKWAEMGDPQAQFLLGRMHVEGHKVEKNNKIATQWLRKSAEQGFKDAQLRLGYMYAMGMGVRYNPQEALKWYHKAGEQDVEEALLNIAMMHVIGEGVPRNVRTAIDYYLKAAVLNNIKAMNLLGIHYRVIGENEEAVKWDRKAAEAGEPHAKVNLGVMLLIGNGVERNAEEGTKWLREAAEYGIVEGQMRLGVAYHEGTGIGKDHVEALKWFLKAGLIDAGPPSAAAQFGLWDLYTKGEGIKHNTTIANRWLIRSADNGHAEAQYELGWNYRLGSNDFEMDIEKALKYYQLSAKQGNAKAQAQMGDIYTWGIGGLKPNPKKGQALMKKAAYNGDYWARLNLGMLTPEEVEELKELCGDASLSSEDGMVLNGGSN